MPEADYESRKDSVLAWKKAQKLGRFDPDAPSIEQQKVLAAEREVQERGESHPRKTNGLFKDALRPPRANILARCYCQCSLSTPPK